VGGFGAAVLRIIHLRLNRRPRTLPADTTIEDAPDDEITALREELDLERARGLLLQERLAQRASIVTEQQ